MNKNPEISYLYVTKVEDIQSVINMVSQVEILACDTEVRADFDKHPKATWKDPHTSKVRLLQLFNEDWDEPVIVDVLKVGIENTMPLVEELAKPKYIKVFHNASYDLKVIRGTFGLWLDNVYCTMVMMQRLGLCVGLKNSKNRGHSYASLASNFFDIDISKTQQSSDWSVFDLSKEQLTYAAFDVGAPRSSGIKSILLEAYRQIGDSLSNEYEVSKSFDLDIRSLKVVAKIEYGGIPVAKETLNSVMEDIKAKLEDMKVEIANMLGLPVSQYTSFENGKLSIKYAVDDEVSKILNNPAKMVALINKVLGNKLDDMKKESLASLLKDLEEEEEEILDSDIEIVRKIIDYKKLLKICGTDYASMINPITKCLSSNYKIIGASTGRMSSGKSDMEENTFNAQQLSNVAITIPDSNDPFKCESNKVIL